MASSPTYDLQGLYAPLPPGVLERVNMLVHDHNPIAAIALVREATGAGIVECKAYVDDLARKSHRMPLHRPRT